jgi:hypothetical protein
VGGEREGVRQKEREREKLEAARHTKGERNKFVSKHVIVSIAEHHC